MLTPLSPEAWSLDHAAHLLNRAGFGGTPDQTRAFHSLGLDAAVGLLVSARDERIAPPSWTGDSPSVRRAEMKMRMTDAASSDSMKSIREQRRREEHQRLVELRAWWLRRMRSSGQPLVEKMTLFWHGHFATSVRKVKSSVLMWRQNDTFRRHALGDFRSLLRAITRDPAMIVWLDLQQSRDGQPNENFARELMELFTLGVGHYSEDDVKAAARAFTGHRVNPRDLSFAFAARKHDHGEKHFLGRSGPFDGDAIVDIILQQPACARFIAGRLWEFFANEDPDPGLLDAAAFSFHRSGHRIAPLLGEIFRSAAFYSPRATRSHIKSPVEWLVESCVALEVDIPAGPLAQNALAQLGQALFEPPNVRGWEGGKAWISSSTLMTRYNLAEFLLGVAPPKNKARLRRLPVVDMARIAPAELRDRPDDLAETLTFRFYGNTRSARLRASALAAIHEAPPPINDRKARTIVQRLMSSPDFQLS